MQNIYPISYVCVPAHVEYRIGPDRVPVLRGFNCLTTSWSSERGQVAKVTPAAFLETISQALNHLCHFQLFQTQFCVL